MSDRPRDEVWDALEAAYGYAPATRTERGKWNKAARDLREANATPQQIRERAAEYRRRWPLINANPLALAAHWGELAPRRQRDWETEVAAFARARADWPIHDVAEDAVDAFCRRANALSEVHVRALVGRALASGDGAIIPLIPRKGGERAGG